MRTLKMTACVLALVACTKKIESQRTDKLEFKSFTVAVPAGWNEVTDQRLTGKMNPGGHALVQVKPPEGFTPSMYVQELELQPAGRRHSRSQGLRLRDGRSDVAAGRAPAVAVQRQARGIGDV
jgi:hypothetical protein